MKRFKSISVDETTFAAVDHLTKTLMPRIRLSKAQVVKNLVKGSHEEITNKKEHHGTEKRHTEDTSRT